jgi:hypothetical protein
MRRANPSELKTPAVPVMTARLSEPELLKWVPVEFDDINDPLATPEPSKAALVKLRTRKYVVLYYGTISNQLTVEMPETTRNATQLLRDFFSEVPLPKSRVLWHRPEAALPERPRDRKRTAARKKYDESESASSTSPQRAKRSALRAALPGGTSKRRPSRRRS